MKFPFWESVRVEQGKLGGGDRRDAVMEKVMSSTDIYKIPSVRRTLITVHERSF